MALMQKSVCAGLVRPAYTPFAVRPVTARKMHSICTEAVKDQSIFELARSAGAAAAAASLLVAGSASAATEVSQLAASDNRFGIIATLFLPALGWVAFNIAQPFYSQLDRMDSLKRSVATAVGLGAAAALVLADSASASTEVAQLAAADNRAGIIATLFVPALGWVAFNIAQPFFSQLDRMDTLKRGVVGAVGVSAAASLLLADSASAASEVAQLAASDNRGAIIATLFVPALGWVAFNIAQPFFAQLERMKK